MRFNLESKAVIAQGVSSPEAVSKFLQSSNQISELRKDFEEKKRQMAEQFRNEFSNISKAFFEAVPRIKSLTWTQYTPYFNDGDECTFRVNSVEFATDENNEIESYRDFENNDGSFSAESYGLKKLVTPEEFKLCEQMESIIGRNKVLMEDLFGDHALVVVRANSIVVEEYDHE
jgi:hypothetical protein